MENELLQKILRRYKLIDGTTIGIGFVGPEDEQRLLNGFKKLSQQTKLYRFQCSKQELSKNEKNYLLNIDNFDHLAIGAVDLDKSYDVGIGLARYIREKENPARAEAAITVIDEYQNGGIGTYLFKELLNYANKNDLKILTSFVFKENLKMIRILDKFNYEVKEDLGNQYRIEVNVAVNP